ncbi:MAG: tripartite tricarboxylate transporter TctB family protein [Deltaproteobacteria bacterium]|nr:tripartite tricarboxylate transporter TctB family protein [Deltaproteobacteria bacterium]
MERAKRDLLMGSLMLVFGIVFYSLTYRFPDYGYHLAQRARAVGLGATFMPRLLFGALILESLLLIVFSLYNTRRKVEREPRRLGPLLQGKPAIMFGAFVVYVYLATLFGFVISTIAFLAVCFYILGVRKVWLLIVVPPVITAAIYYLFEVLLGAWLPSGSLF